MTEYAGIHVWRPGELAWLELRTMERQVTLFQPSFAEIEKFCREEGLVLDKVMEVVRGMKPDQYGLLIDWEKVDPSFKRVSEAGNG